MENQLPAPPLIAMSLSLKTVLNHEKHRNEIVMVSAITNTHIVIDGPTPEPEKFYSHFSAVRQLGALPLPAGFNENVQQQGLKIEICKSERSLLNYLLGKKKNRRY